MASKINICRIRIGSHTEKSCTALYYRKFSKNNTSFVRQGFWPIWANKTGFNLIILHCNISEKMFIILCDYYLSYFYDSLM